MALSKELIGSDHEQTVKNINCQKMRGKNNMKIRYNLNKQSEATQRKDQHSHPSITGSEGVSAL